MPRLGVDDNKRMNLRVCPEQKAMLMPNALREAKEVIEDAERDSLLLVLSLLENPKPKQKR